MYSKISSPRFFFLIQFLFMGLLIAACSGTAPTVSQGQTPQPTCVSTMTGVNPYSSQLPDEVVMMYSDYVLGARSPVQVRREAFSRLADNAKRWSVDRDIVVGQSQMFRITITYLDPTLIHYILLNHALSSSVSPVNSMTIDDFKADLYARMRKIAERNEVLFFVTITSPNYDEQAYGANMLVVNLPFKKMSLINTADLTVLPSRDDHVLNEPINITHGPVSGYISYPISVLSQQNCLLVLDSLNTTLTLDIPAGNVGDIPINPQFWSIPYSPLVAQGEHHPVAAFYPTQTTFDDFYDLSKIASLSTPPRPGWNNNPGLDDQTYWEQMGSYFWYWIMK